MKRSEDKKAIKKFLVIILISFFVGGILGFCSGMMEGEPADVVAGGLYWFLKTGLPYFMPLLLVFQWVAYIVLYRKSKKLYAGCGIEDEETIDRVELFLNYLLLIASISLVCYFFVFGCSTSILFGALKDISLVYFYGILGSYVMGIVSCLIMQYQIITFEKEINPEKNVSIFDTQFAKKWEESCDEAEQLMIYKSAYQAFKAVNGCCITLWVVCCLGNFVWNIGVLPVTMVSVIWLVSLVTYTVACIRLGKAKKMHH